MTALRTPIRDEWPRRLFALVVGVSGLSRLLTGFRERDVGTALFGAVLVAIALAIGLRIVRSPEAVRAARKRSPSLARKKRAEPELLALYGAPTDTLLIPAVVRGAGERLAVRLGPSSNSGLGVILILAITLFVNGVSWPSTCAGSQESGPASFWFLLLNALGIGLAVAAIATVSAWLGARKAPVVEISREPAAPGETFELSVLQRGPARIASYEVRLVCLEAAWRAGGHNKTYKHVLSDEAVLQETAFMVGRGEPWTATRKVAIPEHAMHSFAGRYNTIAWQIVVRANIDGWPDLQQTYPFRVLPTPPGSGR